MALIYQAPTPVFGSSNIFPTQKFAVFGDDLETITRPGYLDVGGSWVDVYPIAPTDIICCFYNFKGTQSTPNFGIFTIKFLPNQVIQLIPTAGVTSGTVNPALAKQLAFYSSDGTAVSGLTNAARAVLSTDVNSNPVFKQLLDKQVLIGADGAAPFAATLTAGTNVSIVSDSLAGTLTISASGGGGSGGLSWINLAQSSAQMAVNSAYVISNAALTTLTLPATAAVGDIVAVQGAGQAGGWRIAQNAGQQIFFNGASTAPGVAGFLQSNSVYDVIYLVCIAENFWAYTSGFGNYILN